MERGYGGWDGAGDGIEEGVFEGAEGDVEHFEAGLGGRWKTGVPIEERGKEEVVACTGGAGCKSSSWVVARL